MVVDPTTGGEVDFLARCLLWSNMMIMQNDEKEGQNTGRKSQYLPVIVFLLIIISMKLKIMMTYFIQEGSCCCVLLTCG